MTFTEKKSKEYDQIKCFVSYMERKQRSVIPKRPMGVVLKKGVPMCGFAGGFELFGIAQPQLNKRALVLKAGAH